MTRDKVLSETLEFKGLAVVLADEVAETGFGEPDACAQFGDEPPFELFGRGVDEVG